MIDAIIGAGLSGCIAGFKFQNVPIFEAGKRPASHNAVLRFRDTSVADLTGIPFDKVRVIKGIYFGGEFVKPNPLVANLYSQKVIGRISNRSILNVDPVDRYIAPLDFHEIMLDMLGNRVSFETPYNFAGKTSGNIISTAPMPVVLNQLGIDDTPEFSFRPITVLKYKLIDCDQYCTVYYPEIGNPVYRASITKDELIIECTGLNDNYICRKYLFEVLSSLGLDPMNIKGHFVIDGDYVRVKPIIQKYGKITEVKGSRELVYQLTTDFGIYSIGRFANWRNILLDDVVKDLNKVQAMQRMDKYQRRLEAK